MIRMRGQMTGQKLTVYPLACRNKPKPTSMIIAPMTMLTIIPPPGKPKHSLSTRL